MTLRWQGPIRPFVVTDVWCEEVETEGACKAESVEPLHKGNPFFWDSSSRRSIVHAVGEILDSAPLLTYIYKQIHNEA